MANPSRLTSRLLLVVLMALLAGVAFADPPGRVGRLADVQGAVWFYDAVAGEWVAAARNRTLTSGDRIATDADARAEVRVGSTTLRLGAGTELELLQLDDDIVRLQLHNGLLALRLRNSEVARGFELVSAEGRFKPDRAGRYRLDRVDATSSVTVWSGQLLFEAPDNAVMLVAGQRADIWNDGRTQYTLVQPQRDAFADEVAAAEMSDERSVSAQFVSPEMTGVEDLDRYGRWETDPEYGALWVPQAVAPGWAPYRFGHWAWIAPWGWTWIDDAPWGFAPFHYGRWVYQRNVWCWAPGRRVARPVYAPALVAWVGAPEAGVSVAIGVGPTVGWFPLAPREVFVPGYRASPEYIRNVNVTHVTNIVNINTIINNPNAVVQQTRYVNRGVPGAMTVVPASVVSSRQPVAPARVHLTDPRPGGEPGVPPAALVAVTAAPPIQAPVSHRGGGNPPMPPRAPGSPGPDAVRPGAASPHAPSAAVAPATPSAAAAPQPMPRPAIRDSRPTGDAARAVEPGTRSPPASAAPLPVTPVRPLAPAPAAPPTATVSPPHSPPPPVPAATVPNRAPSAPPVARTRPPELQTPAKAPVPSAPAAPVAAPVAPKPAPVPAPAGHPPAGAAVATPAPPAVPAAHPPAAPAAPAANPQVTVPAAPKPAQAPPPRGREPKDEPREAGKAEK